MNATQEFIAAVASELGGRLRSDGEHVELEVPGRPPVIIDSSANGQQVSHDRLELVEKQAAIALLADPKSFSIAVRDDSWKQNRRLTLFRVAFGYYIVNGARCFQRYTAYYDVKDDIGAVLVGEDNLFLGASEDAKLDYGLRDAYAHKHKLVSLVQSACQHFINGQRQTAEFQAIADSQRDRDFELDLLYRRTSKQHIRSFGVDLYDLKSRPPSVSDEFHRRKLDVVTRHIPKVAVIILSTGVVNSPAKGQKKHLQMPFLPGPSDERWITSWQTAPNGITDNE